MALHLLDKKELDDFSKRVRDTFSFMSIKGRYKIVGSASLVGTKYAADYDLQEKFGKEHDGAAVLNAIWREFKAKYSEAEKEPSIFITDLKLGQDSDGEGLHWTKEQVRRGYKPRLDGTKALFVDCILAKATFKLDVVKLIDGIFIEFSDNYSIKLGDEANFLPQEMTKGAVLAGLAHDYDEYMNAAHTYFKALKRSFAYKMHEDPKGNKAVLERMLAFFNGRTGLLYKSRSEIETLILILENNFRRPRKEDVRNNIRIVYRRLLQNVQDMRVFLHLRQALEAKIVEKMVDHLSEASVLLLAEINGQTLVFIKGCPRALLDI